MRNANHVPGAANAATLTALVQVRSNVGSNTLGLCTAIAALLAEPALGSTAQSVEKTR